MELTSFIVGALFHEPQHECTQVSDHKVLFQLRIKWPHNTIGNQRYALQFVPLGSKDLYTSEKFEFVKGTLK